VQQAFAAAGDDQQLTVVRHAPAPRNAVRLERLIEGDAMPIAFGLGDGAVHVPEDGLEHCRMAR
jgi:hypothetical protein